MAFGENDPTSQITRTVQLWRADLLGRERRKQAEALADPAEYSNLFPDLSYGLIAEDAFRRRNAKGLPPASEYVDYKDSGDWDLIGGKEVILAVSFVSLDDRIPSHVQSCFSAFLSSILDSIKFHRASKKIP